MFRTCSGLGLAAGCWLAVLSPALASSTAEQADPAPERRPNVLLIVIDTLRADHLAAYGYDRPTSPHLDRLASEGVLYEQCISASSWTLPAHASLFTGLFPRDHRCTSETQNLADSFDTLAEILRASGYHTGGFSNNVWTHDESGLKQGFDHFLELWRQQDSREEGISLDDRDTDMGATVTNERVLEWLDGLSDRERPWFVFINYFEPHLPYRPARPHDGDFLPAEVDPKIVQRLRSFYSPREYSYILRTPWGEVSAEELAVLTSLYDAEIAYVDAKIGELVAGLRARDLLDDTLLVVTSDHGEHLGENHMLDHKLSVYEPLLRVPLILWNPKRLAGGVRVGAQVQAHDVFGTILDLSAARRGDFAKLPFDGQGKEYTFAELAYPGIFLELIAKRVPGWSAKPFARALKAVRGPRYKLIWGSDERVELYDVVADPYESHDLAADRPDVVEKLRRVLESFNGGTSP